MISVLLPTYNSASTLKSAIKSILNQTFREFELLVLDDGSTDTSGEIISSFHDSRIRYIPLEHRGLTQTLNDGLRLATYDIIARMDADDVCVPQRFEKQLSLLKRLPEHYLLSCWYAIFVDTSIQYVIKTPTVASEIKKGLLLYSYLSHPGMMFIKNILLECGGYRSSAETDAFEDYATWLQIKEKVEFAIIPEVLVFQRYRKNSLSNNIAYKQKTMYAIQVPYYSNLQRHFGVTGKEEVLYRGWREYF
ncbi:MAG: glycosyltransferase, partial [Bacteroidota bacterium]